MEKQKEMLRQKDSSGRLATPAGSKERRREKAFRAINTLWGAFYFSESTVILLY